MNDLNALLVPWTIVRTAKPFPEPEILVANRIIRTGVKTSPEALEAAVSEVLANHQALLAELFKRVSDDATQLVKTHRTAKEDFTVFWKRVFCKRNPSPATDTTSYLREVVSEVFGGTPSDFSSQYGFVAEFLLPDRGVNVLRETHRPFCTASSY